MLLTLTTGPHKCSVFWLIENNSACHNLLQAWTHD